MKVIKQELLTKISAKLTNAKAELTLKEEGCDSLKKEIETLENNCKSNERHMKKLLIDYIKSKEANIILSGGEITVHLKLPEHLQDPIYSIQEKKRKISNLYFDIKRLSNDIKVMEEDFELVRIAYGKSISMNGFHFDRLRFYIN